MSKYPAAGLNRRVNIRILIKGGQHNHFGCPQTCVGNNPACRLQPIHLRHANIHQHHIGQPLLHQPEATPTILRFPNHGNLRVMFQ
ncbi:MAG: hypothetical protein R2932_31445 [Caldilineaceae bacterium]